MHAVHLIFVRHDLTNELTFLIPFAKRNMLSQLLIFQNTTIYPFSWNACLQVKISVNQLFSSVNQCESAMGYNSYLKPSLHLFKKKKNKVKMRAWRFLFAYFLIKQQLWENQVCQKLVQKVKQSIAFYF